MKWQQWRHLGFLGSRWLHLFPQVPLRNPWETGRSGGSKRPQALGVGVSQSRRVARVSRGSQSADSLAEGPAPHEVRLILGITASHAAGVEPSLSVPVNGAETAFDSLKATQRGCPRADNDTGRGRC